MGIVMEEKQKGFTIIEVMLFLALSGLLLSGILMSTGSSIANQRYKDAVQDVVDVLRDAYSFVSDTEVQLRDKNTGVCGGLTEGDLNSLNQKQDINSGRGRTNCDVYGAVVSINKDTIQTTTLIGLDYADMINSGSITGNENKSDIELLQELQANNLAAQCASADQSTCYITTASSAHTQKIKWDAILKKKKEGDDEPGDFKGTILIFRSPRTGAIRTYYMDDLITYNDKPVDYNEYSGTGKPYNSYGPELNGAGVFSRLKTGEGGFNQAPVILCVDSNGAESYASHRRMIRIARNAHSQTDIELVDMDAEGEDSCD